jgi:hypothetical protein
MPKWFNRVRNTLKRTTRSGKRKLQNLAYKTRRAFSTKNQRQRLLNKRFETLKKRMAEDRANWETNYRKNQATRAASRQLLNNSRKIKTALMNEIKNKGRGFKNYLNARSNSMMENMESRRQAEAAYAAALENARLAEGNIHAGANAARRAAASAAIAGSAGVFGSNNNW